MELLRTFFVITLKVMEIICVKLQYFFGSAAKRSVFCTVRVNVQKGGGHTDILKRKRLAAAASKGDTKAFSLLYEEIYKKLYYCALANLRNSEDAADAVSDAVLDAFMHIGELKRASAFESWVFTILHGKIVKKQREYARAQELSRDADPETSPTREGGFTRCEILEELSELSEDQRICITLSSIAGYRSSEIAAITGMKPSTVRSHISRARGILKKNKKEVT